VNTNLKHGSFLINTEKNGWKKQVHLCLEVCSQLWKRVKVKDYIGIEGSGILGSDLRVSLVMQNSISLKTPKYSSHYDLRRSVSHRWLKDVLKSFCDIAYRSAFFFFFFFKAKEPNHWITASNSPNIWPRARKNFYLNHHIQWAYFLCLLQNLLCMLEDKGL